MTFPQVSAFFGVAFRHPTLKRWDFPPVTLDVRRDVTAGHGVTNGVTPC